MQINTELIESLRPCEDRFQNWLKHYKTFSGNITEFLALEHITPRDKIWVAVRLMPRDLVETFAFDCASVANVHADAGYAAAEATAEANAYAAKAKADANAFAAAYAAATAAAYAAATAAAYAAAYAATADAPFTDAYAAERKRQIALPMDLIETHNSKN